MTTKTEETVQQTHPPYRYYKAITPEASVNTKNRFDKNKIKWVEDITYKNTGNKAYFLQIPYEQTYKPAGCKRMYFIQYYPGPNQEFVSDADAAMFYTMIYPRYEHVAQQIIHHGKSLIPWRKLDEQAKQNFVAIWGKVILSHIYVMNDWKTNYTDRPTGLEPRNKYVKASIEDENVQQFLSDDSNKVSERVTLQISCSKEDIPFITSALSFESPTIYTLPTPEK